MRDVSHMRTAAVTATMFLALAAGLPVADATHGDHLPLIDNQAYDRGYWSTFILSTDGSHLTVDLEAMSPVTESQGLGIYGYTMEDDRWFGAAFNGIAGHHDLVLDASMDDLEDLPAVSLEHGLEERPDGSYTLRIQFNMNAPGSTSMFVGSFKLLVYGIGAVESTSWELRGASGVTMDARLEGFDAQLVMGEDFERVAHFHAGTAGLGGQGLVRGSMTLDVENTCFCTLSRTGNSPYVMTLETDGDVRFLFFGGGSHFFKGPNRIGPGTATFSVTGAGAGASWQTHVYLTALDVRMP